MLNRLFTVVLISTLASLAPVAPTNPFDASRLRTGIDSFVLVTRVTGERPVGYVVQTLLRDTALVRLGVDYDFGPTNRQRSELVMTATLAPLAHVETIERAGQDALQSAIRFRDGRARGAFIRATRILDVPIDPDVVDDEASTALLPALPLSEGYASSFRSFASPGQIDTTRVTVVGRKRVVVPAGQFDAFEVVVMTRDTSHVFVSADEPRRVVLVRLLNGTEMRLVNRRR